LRFSVAATVEMGDGARRLLAMLNEECPDQTRNALTHRARASLWAHAVETMARLGQTNGLRPL
jgi:hypothetical protein